MADVANAILDGTDAVMLSGEAAGKYPVEAVRNHGPDCRTHEQDITIPSGFQAGEGQRKTIADSISQAVSRAALDLNASAILTPTESGYTARLISKYRPKAPIVAITPHERVARKLSLWWGVYPLVAPAAKAPMKCWN